VSTVLTQYYCIKLCLRAWFVSTAKCCARCRVCNYWYACVIVDTVRCFLYFGMCTVCILTLLFALVSSIHNHPHTTRNRYAQCAGTFKTYPLHMQNCMTLCNWFAILITHIQALVHPKRLHLGTCQTHVLMSTHWLLYTLLLLLLAYTLNYRYWVQGHRLLCNW
jgi:uncharacterized membrane protein